MKKFVNCLMRVFNACIYIKNTYPIVINIMINGRRTKNHEIDSNPLLHIKFKIHVQNNTYTTFIIKIKNVLVTLHE